MTILFLKSKTIQTRGARWQGRVTRTPNPSRNDSEFIRFPDSWSSSLLSTGLRIRCHQANSRYSSVFHLIRCVSWHFGKKSYRKEREGVGCYFANRAVHYTLRIKGPVPAREEGEPQEAQKCHLGKMASLNSEKSWRTDMVLWLLSPWYRFSDASLRNQFLWWLDLVLDFL